MTNQKDDSLRNNEEIYQPSAQYNANGTLVKYLVAPEPNENQLEPNPQLYQENKPKDVYANQGAH